MKPKISLSGAERNPFVILCRAEKALTDKDNQSRMTQVQFAAFREDAGGKEVNRYATDSTPREVTDKVISKVREVCSF